MLKGKALYLKGVRKERKIVNEAREKGLISFRSAGSHSPIDVVIIDVKSKTVQFIQAKTGKMSSKARGNLEMKYWYLNDPFFCTFRVV